MKEYRPEDLKIVEGAITLIRKNSSMYAGERPWGPAFAASLVRDLVFLDALPAHVEKYGEWWVVSSEKDWLATPCGTTSLVPFSRIVPFPKAGQNCHRSEILLSALADCVVTFGSEGPTWIVGDHDRNPLPPQLSSNPLRAGWRRSVAYFLYETE